ncbi:MAG: acyl-CoA dehydrogenase family protein [Myxococcota bacterium]|nr:acyl-CoA dehydrogenase family protein [Myxococcota bacterium]
MDTSLLLTEPELRPFLPLLYVAWADGDFSPEQRALLTERIEGQPWLTPPLREALVPWLRPQQPPSAEALAQLGETLRTVAATLSEEAKSSLGALARGMAVAGGASGAALAQVEELLAALEPDPDALRLPRDQPEDSSLWGPPRFDLPALQRLLDGRFAPAREQVRAFLAQPEHRAAFGLSKEAYREQVFTWLQTLADRGLGQLAFPGVTSKAKDLGEFFATIETLALGDLSLWVKFGVQFGLWGGSIYFLGTEEQKAAWLPKVASLEAPGCFAMSEVGHGSNVADLETVARYDPATGELVIHSPRESARKDWAGNAAVHGRYATVFAQLEVGGAHHGVHAVIVPIRDALGNPAPGIRIGDSGQKMGLNGVDNGRLWFDQVWVPKSSLLGRYATITEDHRYESTIQSPSRRFFTMLGTLVGGRISVSTAALSASKVGLAVAIRYAAARRQFGPTSQPETLLLRYPTHQRRLFPALAATYAYHFALDELREQFLALPRDSDSRELEARAAGLKAGATWHATRTLQLCREACGGQGYLSVNRIPDLKNDAEIFTTFEGDNTVLLQLLAKSLLTGFRQQFASGGAVKVVRYLAGQAVTAIREKNPFVTRGTDPQTLRSADFQLAALRFREQSLLASAGRRLQKRHARKMDPALALNEVQEHVVALALAHVDRIVLESFVRAEEQAPSELREQLGRLRALHGLCTLEGQLGWLQANDYVESARAKAIRKQVPLLFAELLPDAIPLVDAFGIPAVCLGAPIAFHDPAHPR